MKLKTKLTISSWNVQGLFYRNNNERFSKLHDTDFVDQIKSDIVCFLETKAQKGDNLTLKDYTLLKHCFRQRNGKGIYGGIALYSKASITKGITILNTKSTEYMWVKLDRFFFNHQTDIYICFVYNSPKYSTFTKRQSNLPSALEMIEDDITKYSTMGNTVLLGDFNAHTSTSDLDFVSGDYGKGMEDILPNAYISDSVLLSRNSLKSNIKTDDYGRMLLDLCISSQCRILNGRTLGDTVGNLTSFQYNGCAVVDYCVVDQRLLDSVNFFKIGDFTTFSDHCQLTACFSLNHFENNYKLERKSPKGIKWSKNVADVFQSLILSDSVERSIQNFLSFSWDPNKSDINEATENISSIYQVINKSLNESFSCKVKTKCKKIKKKNKKWFDQDCDSMYRNLKSIARSLPKSCNKPGILQHYYLLRKQYKKLIRKKQRMYKNKLLGSLIDLESRDSKSFWKVINDFKNSDSSVSDQSSNIAPDAWYQYFNGLMNVEGINESSLPEGSCISSNFANEFSEPITLKEVRTGIRSLKNNTSVGYDCISNEMLKYSSSSMVQCICKLFNLVYESGCYPSQWSESMIKPLFKSGSENDPSNYRGISISSCLSKLFSRVLYNRLDTYIFKNDILVNNQIGFRKSFRPTDHVYTLKSMIDKSFRNKTYLYSCFIDLRKAFDTVWREALFYKLLKYGVNGKLFNILKAMYSDVKYAIKLQAGLTESFSSNIGVKQGCILSPLLFNLFVNDLPNCFDSSKCDPIPMGDALVNCLMYADDVVLLSSSKEGLQHSLSSLQKYCDSWNLKINIEKTKILIFNKSGKLLKNDKFFINGILLENVQEYKYLGILMRASGTFTNALMQYSI